MWILETKMWVLETKMQIHETKMQILETQMQILETKNKSSSKKCCLWNKTESLCSQNLRSSDKKSWTSMRKNRYQSVRHKISQPGEYLKFLMQNSKSARQKAKNWCQNVSVGEEKSAQLVPGIFILKQMMW